MIRRLWSTSASCFAALLLWLLPACAETTPSFVRRELSKSPQGVVTIVFFTDFQCPHCRRTHSALVEASAGRAMRIVVRHVPLPTHPDAWSAAAAAVCAEHLPRSSEYLNSLYRSHELSASTCEDLAVAHGADREVFRSCVADRQTAERIAADTAMFESVHGDGVPLLYVGRRRMAGAQTSQELSRAITEVARGLR